MKPLLTIDQLSLSLSGKEILKDVSCQFQTGSCSVLIGPSGSGKSSLLKTLNLLNEYDAGLVCFNGKDIKKISKIELRKKIGMVFQQYNLFDHLSVLDNCALALKRVLNLKKRDAYEIAQAYLTKVKMNDFVNAFPRQLSGGQQQRVAIARAMCLQPEVLLLDEPTAALDPEMSFEVLETIKSLAEEGVTMIYVTHEINLARHLADQVIFIEEGRVVAQGDVKEVLDTTKNNRIKKFIEQIEHRLYGSE
ncbi:MAG: amino acid ABC transporter ATP-binding protein [Gammaproteobacteria bacterium]|nr:amino acid ABC transporter ATP-binding protein [Gammaproteobacteria bacterium]